MVFLIRHAKVHYKWKLQYSLSGFIKAGNEYDSAEIEEISIDVIKQIREKIPETFDLYTSDLKRSIDTAEIIFPDKKIVTLHELSEVPIEPYTNDNRKHLLCMWLLFGRLQWFMNNKKQRRSKAVVKNEISNIMKIIDSNKDSVIIGHGFQFRMMIKLLKNKFVIVRKNGKYIKNLDVIECRERVKA